MTQADKILQTLVAQAWWGSDAVIVGELAAARGLLARSTAAIARGADVITASAAAGPLSLSSLIGQIAGHSDFDGQDDSVLQLGFHRLNTPRRRTVLVLQAPQGLSRSALRYVQHLSSQAPNLVLLVLASPALDAMLEEKAFSGLRARLRAALTVDPVTPQALLAGPARGETAPRRRWSNVLTMSVIGVAAAILAIAWFGQRLSLIEPAIVSRSTATVSG